MNFWEKKANIVTPEDMRKSKGWTPELDFNAKRSLSKGLKYDSWTVSKSNLQRDLLKSQCRAAPDPELLKNFYKVKQMNGFSREFPKRSLYKGRPIRLPYCENETKNTRAGKTNNFDNPFFC